MDLQAELALADGQCLGAMGGADPSIPLEGELRSSKSDQLEQEPKKDGSEIIDVDSNSPHDEASREAEKKKRKRHRNKKRKKVSKLNHSTREFFFIAVGILYSLNVVF